MLGNRFKGSLRCTLRQTALSAGIRARFDLLPCFVATLSRVRQARVGVGAHGQHLFLAVPVIAESPPFRPVWLHKQAQSTSVGEPAGSILRIARCGRRYLSTRYPIALGWKKERPPENY